MSQDSQDAEAGQDPHSDIAGMSFETALAELEQIVRKLEAGQDSLEESIHAYERGARLKQHCDARLRDAQAKVERIAMAGDGHPDAEPMDKPQS